MLICLWYALIIGYGRNEVNPWKNDKEMEKVMGQIMKVMKALKIITPKEVCKGQVDFICIRSIRLLAKCICVNFMS